MYVISDLSVGGAEMMLYKLLAETDRARFEPAVVSLMEGGALRERVEDVPETIDIVEIFRRPEGVWPAVEGAIRAGAKVVWMQLGIENLPAAEQARAAGLTVVMDACLLVEHKKRKPL